MATSSSEESLEFWLSKAINVLAKEEDWEAIVGFCDRVNKDSDGPQNAVRLLTHKIQSPQEKESLLALTVLEACVKNCGRRFQQEIGKFRFLNEIIKLLSPKFMGNYTSVKVKQKCTELLFYWTEVLEYEPKIKEAYEMLRRQGIIKEDPVIRDWTAEVDSPPPPPPPPPSSSNSVFEDEEKSKLLSRLLRSKNPDDLMAANRLIKNMVKQDAERSEKVSLRILELDIVYNNVKLLGDMLQNYQPGGATQSDKEIMKELYDNLENHRPKLFRLASDADESDESGIADILKANDEVIRVMALYEDLVNKADVGNLLVDAESTGPSASSLSDLQSLSTSSVQNGPSIATSSDLLCENPPSLSILDDQLQRLGLGSISLTNGSDSRTTNSNERDDLTDPFSSSGVKVSHPSMDLSSSAVTSSSIFASAAVPLQPLHSNGLSQPTPFNLLQPANTSFPPVTANTIVPAVYAMFRNPAVTSMQPAYPPSTLALGANRPLYQSPMPVLPVQQPLLPQPTVASPVRTASSAPQSAMGGAGMVASVAPKTSSGLESLDAMGRSALMDSLSTKVTATDWNGMQSSNVQSKVPMNQMSKVTTVPSATSNLPPSTVVSSSAAGDISSSDVLPLTDVFVPLDSIKPGGMPPLVAFDKNGIKIMFHFGKDRPRLDVLVIAVSIMNSNGSPVKGFVFQAAVPKVMKIKLQPASATDLPAFNPILPLAAITQVMLIAHRPQDKILLRFKITYSINDALTTDVGEVQFSSSDTLL